MIPHFNIELQNKEAKTNFEQINGLVLARYINLGKKFSWPFEYFMHVNKRVGTVTLYLISRVYASHKYINFVVP